MWYKSESTARPAAVDATSSKKYVYIRKNIKEVERKDEMTEIKVKFYQYDEVKIPKEIYPIMEAQTNQNDRLNDIEDAIAEIIGGEII